MVDTNDTIDSYKSRFAELQQENTRLRTLLLQHGISPDPPTPVSEPTNSDILKSQAVLLYTSFRGRKDVYSKRSITKDGHAAYYPVCQNFWEYGLCPKREGRKQRCTECHNRAWTPLGKRVLMEHIVGEKEDGTDVIGIYPLLEDETCHFLVFDFDDHAQDALQLNSWQEEADALREICRQLEVPCLVERSRSGCGAHVWLLFEAPIPAELARRFGSALLTQGAELVNQRSFRTYDRMLPAHDHMPVGGLGNLIALPLQGKAVQEGNSVFVDESWTPYNDQWEYLENHTRIAVSLAEEKTKEWSQQGVLGILATAETDSEKMENRKKPWKTEPFPLHPEDVEGTVQMILADQLYVDTANLRPRFQNMLRRMASFSNPAYYKKLAMGFSGRNIPRIVACFREEDGYLILPRGKTEQMIAILHKQKIPYELSDERQYGQKIKVSFQGELYPEQQKAAEKMLEKETGILAAATAFGKTAVGAWLVAERGVNTLVLVHNREIMKNWVEDFQKFLLLEEELPVYTTASGRQKKRKNLIGTKYGGHDSTAGILDVAMISSLGKPGEIDELVTKYGMVLMDECHHGAAQTMEEVLRKVNARYVYGLTATPKRDDGMEPKVMMQLGDVCYRFTAKDKAKLQGIRHIIRPRFTRLTNISKPWKIQEAYENAVHDPMRNRLIADDVVACVQEGKTPLVLTKFKEHAEILRVMLAEEIPNLFVLQGGRSTAEREEIRRLLKSVPENAPMAVIAIGKYIGEGFNLPRLDTMMLAAPIAWEGNVEQYAGRLHRDFEGKTETVIYDYIDAHVPVLNRMYHKRLRAYRKIGYELYSPASGEVAVKNTIYDSSTYKDSITEDLMHAKKEIILSSPVLSSRSVKWFMETVGEAQKNGVSVTVLTLASEHCQERYRKQNRHFQEELKQSGVFVVAKPILYTHFAVLDREVVWYGSMNLLGTVHEEETMMRLENEEIAVELLEMVDGGRKLQ